MSAFLPEAQLLTACRIPGSAGFKPHPTQSLRGLRSFFRSRLETDESLIVLAVDGLSFEAARATWTSTDLLAPLTSTFPSVSGTAWITAATGLGVEEHLVPGVVYRLPETGALYNYYADDPPAAPRQGGWPTLFTDLTALGVEAVALPGDMGPWPADLENAVLAGARKAPSAVDWESLRYAPQAMAGAMIREIDALLGARRPGSRLFLWAYVNVDDAVHRVGYDEAVLASLGLLEEAAVRWQGQGHTVAAHGDHGLVPNDPSPAVAAAFHAANDPSLCRLPSGGAGRVLWSYPHPGREDEVLARLTDAVGHCAEVVPTATLAEQGLFGWNRELAARVGEICSLAVGPEFPAPFEAGRCFEHGSFTAAEMLTALAVWSA